MNCSTLTVAGCAGEISWPPVPVDATRRSPHRSRCRRAGPHPHRRRGGRVAGPCNPRGQRRDLGTGGADLHPALRRQLTGLVSQQDRPRRDHSQLIPRFRTGSNLDPRGWHRELSADSQLRPPTQWKLPVWAGPRSTLHRIRRALYSRKPTRRSASDRMVGYVQG
jgi:hypothetical protein